MLLSIMNFCWAPWFTIRPNNTIYCACFVAYQNVLHMNPYKKDCHAHMQRKLVSFDFRYVLPAWTSGQKESSLANLRGGGLPFNQKG